MSTWIAVLYALWSGAPPGTGAAPAAAHAPPSAAVAAEVARLEGHRVDLAPDGRSYAIADVAGEGPPVVGVVERRGRALYLLAGDAAHRLIGPLARPRIAGPGYKVWVLGAIEGDALRARRLGVLAPPPR